MATELSTQQNRRDRYSHPSRFDVDPECLDCGVAVKNKQKHDEWHDALGKLRLRPEHRNACPAPYNPDAPCTCGASAALRLIRGR